MIIKYKLFWFPKQPIKKYQEANMQNGTLMAHSHWTGPGQGPEMMGLYIMLCTVYTTQGQGQEQITIIFYCAHPGPCPCPSPVQCV